MVPTIFAPATAPGRAVSRSSGCRDRTPDGSHDADRPPPARSPMAAFVRLSIPESGEFLDQGLVLWFPAPHSFTGEDWRSSMSTADGRVSPLDRRSGKSAGTAVAEPGEFSRRGFENGKFDLTAAEAIADLVDADTAAQRRQALRQMEGELAGSTTVGATV